LRRTSPIAQYAVSASLEALGNDVSRLGKDGFQLGIIYTAQSGCVNYSRRFYTEVLKEPATASPLIFPETVFNAPSSHLAALLGTTAINYTLIGDAGTFLQAMALAADWLLSGRVGGCLVIGAEEMDWLVAEAFCLFDPEGIVSGGAGALYLKCEPGNSPAVRLFSVTTPELFSKSSPREEAVRRTRRQLDPATLRGLLCDGLQGISRLDRAELMTWKDWAGARLSPKRICGEAFTASAAWQCVAAVDTLAQSSETMATVSVVGCNQQAVAAQFQKA
jgi:hypothetical protein